MKQKHLTKSNAQDHNSQQMRPEGFIFGGAAPRKPTTASTIKHNYFFFFKTHFPDQTMIQDYTHTNMPSSRPKWLEATFRAGTHNSKINSQFNTP